MLTDVWSHQQRPTNTILYVLHTIVKLFLLQKASDIALLYPSNFIQSVKTTILTLVLFTFRATCEPVDNYFCSSGFWSHCFCRSFWKCACHHRCRYQSGIIFLLVTQSKSKTQITRNVHCKFNCITVKYDGTRHGI